MSLQRKKPFARGGPLERTPMKRKPRPKAERDEKFAREFHSTDRREWVSWLPCLACSVVPCENHHTRNAGKGLKGPYQSIVPLCLVHHMEAHATGIKSFEKKYADRLCGRTLVSWAETVQAAWLLWHGEAA